MSIPLSRYNRAMAHEDSDEEERFRTLTPAMTEYSMQSGKTDSNYYYEHQWKDTMGKTFVGSPEPLPQSMADSMMPSPYIMPERTANGYAPSSVGETSTIALVPKQPKSTLDPLGPRLKQAFVALRVVHTFAAVLLASCVCAMQVYMLMGHVTVVAVPHFVCRVILMAMAVVLVLCDWKKPRSVLRHFPMYSDKRSWKGLGLTQVVVAFFVLGDSTLAEMRGATGDRFSRVLFPLVLAFSSLMLVVGVAYFAAGAIGGVRIKQRFQQ
ncbi:hypothetical protein IW140_003253 [Coemansia sp. RSA 1813]|nr:hypothetical protein EV178_002508 [Coemansia sp. RSA 1646]KAJ1765415.1 hypothetical protein LPJ74_006359 [Coemansia sp. RSA 1843]KAJ2085366.1 hypothetical protein IW138_006370 [Coemansia sp. RSA 986]KAJ2213782.1 hypothetical protein EV179_003587 [Coemansia sp. RSA 487]KAJ2569275.1 hypothetical protein IW140_003253 [Coemansia sp. RSA 1813]